MGSHRGGQVSGTRHGGVEQESAKPWGWVGELNVLWGVRWEGGKMLGGHE